MKKLSYIFLLIMMLSCGGNQEVAPLKNDGSFDGWTFTVEVGVEKRTADAVGGYEKVKTIIENQFAEINNKFNRPGVFNKTFCFRISSFFMFEGPSSNFCLSSHPCCDVRMIVNGFCSEDDAGGGWYSGDIKCIHHRWNMDHNGGPFGKSATDGIAHEFGHVRGAIDIYALKVDQEKNPVNHTAFEGVKSIMNGCYGEDEWDLHSINMINASADSINPPDLRDLFPQKIGVKILDQNGTPVPACILRFFPVSWYSGEVQNMAVIEGISAGDGLFFFPVNPFGIASGDEYPWNIRYCNFLVEANHGGKTGYAWMPINEVQNPYFKGEDFILTVRL
jgi:hypothetical protein